MNENERNAALDIWNKKEPVTEEKKVEYTHVFLWRVGISKISDEQITDYMHAVQGNLKIPADNRVLQYFLPEKDSDEIKLSIVNLETGNVSEV